MTSYRKVREFAKQYDKSLRANDPRFVNGCTVIHEEGTVFCFESAFAVKIEEYYVIFTEHHGTHVYDEDDVQVRMRGQRVTIQQIDWNPKGNQNDN